MNIIKILLKNSLRIFWKFKYFMLQFCLLLLIAITILSSVFLSISSLNTSYDNVLDKGINPQASIEYENDDKDKVDFKINDKDFKIGANNNMSFNWSDIKLIPNMIYNPIIKTPINSNGKNLQTFGYFAEFSNPSQLPPNIQKDVWPNLSYSVNFEYANSVNTLKTNMSFKNILSDVFSFYNDIIPITTTTTNLDNSFYKNLYDLNNYSFNPWSLKLDNNKNLSVSNFGIATINGFQNNNAFYLKHGVYDKEMGAIVNTTKSIFNIPENILNERWKQIFLNISFNKYLDNLSNNVVPCSVSPTRNDFITFFKKHNNIIQPDSQNTLNVFSKEYVDFLNTQIELIKNNFFIKSIGHFEIRYKVNSKNSNTIVKFVANKFETNKNLFNPDDSKFFEGIMQIPVIPFLTIIPKNSYQPTEQELNDCSTWTNDNWEVNSNVIDTLISSTLIEFKNNVNEICDKKINDFKTTNPDIYNEYLQNYDIFNVIKNNNYDFSTTSYFNIKDSDKSFIVSENNSSNAINKIVVDEGIDLLKPNFIKFNNFDLNIKTVLDYLIELHYSSEAPSLTTNQLLDPLNCFSDLFNFFSVIKETNFKTTELNKKIIFNFSTYLSNPINAKENIDNYNKTLKDFAKKFVVVNMTKQKYGFYFDLQEVVNGLNTVFVQFTGDYYVKESNIVLVSRNWTEFKNRNKKVIDSKFLNDALLLPNNYISLTKDEIYDEINKNPINFVNNFIFNPYTNKKEFYLNFNDWLNKIPNEFKININNNNYVISGSGISPEFIYPIETDNQVLLNNSIPVVFCNSASFSKIYSNSSNKITKNIWLKSKDYNLLNPNFQKSFKKLNRDISNISSNLIAYETNDESQPNKLTYLRINFSKNILNVLTIFLVGIGLIIGLLAFFFVATLLRSIIKQNINTLAICLSNGVNKFKLVVSLSPIVLIPAFISTLIGYGISLGLYVIFDNIIISYWALNIDTVYFSIIYFIVLLLISITILSILLICIVYWTLRKETSQLLVSRVEFRMNKLIILLSPLLSKLNSLFSFRLSYILGNITRLIVLMVLSTTFITLCTTFVSSNNTFNNAITQTNKNKDYTYAIDLFSPTISGGYYSPINYNEFGTTQEGFIPLYDLTDNSPEAIYGAKFKDALTYDPTPNDPNNNDELVYTNLALPNVSYVKDIQSNILFFKNQFWSRLVLDYNIDFLGIKINPWIWAQKVIPSSITNIADNLFNNQINDAISYFYYLFNSNDNSNDKYIWYFDYYDIINNKDPNAKKPNLLDDLKNKNNEISKNPEDWNQTNWTYNYVFNTFTQKYEWKLNEKNISLGLPTFELKPSVVKLATYISSFTENPKYVAWKQQNNEEVKNKNFFLALNAVPFDKNTESYSYIDGSVINDKDNQTSRQINIKGIKPNSSFISLYDAYDNNIDLKTKLDEYEKNNTEQIPVNNPVNNIKIYDQKPIPYSDGSYPIIINEVVAKKYGLDNDDILNVAINNTFDRFQDKFINIEPSRVKFKVIGITTSKSEEQYYTTQTVANYVLHYKKPELANRVLDKGNVNNVWINPTAVKNYIPFNGVFTKDEQPLFFTNDAVVYSQSGLSPLSGQVPTLSIDNDTTQQIKNNWTELNNILKVNIVNNSISPNSIDVLNFSSDFEKLYNSPYYLSLALNNIDFKKASEFLGSVMDETTADIYQIILISFIPTLIIIVFLISYIVVIESRRLISLLKVLGFNDFTNTITLTLIYFIVLAISMLIATGLTYLVTFIFRTLIFEYLSIIINPVAPWWIYLATFVSLFFVNCSLAGMTYYKLSHTNTAFEISYR